MAMEDRPRNSRALTSAHPVMDTGAAEEYFRRLLVERPYIRSALENQGGSIILQSHANAEHQHVSTICGNDAHLDLLDAEDILRSMDPEQAAVLLLWSAGLPDEVAGELLKTTRTALRKRRSRAIKEAEPARVLTT